MQLLGEYVLEIVVDIAERIERDRVNGSCLLEALSQFAHENPAFVTLTEARARSYWAEYYRREFVWSRGLSGADCHLSHQRVEQLMDRAPIGMTARIAADPVAAAHAICGTSERHGPFVGRRS
ncbi:hypothetical protein ACXC9Q_31630 [Kribbella sp. CWNU-51]